MSWLTLPKLRDQNGKFLDGFGKYTVIDPDELYRGKSYGEWATDWLNWFLSKDADRRNTGPVVFLRSKGLPNEKTGANISDIPKLSGGDIVPEAISDTMSTDVNGTTGYSKPYVNDPNVRIGGDRLQIFEDQAVFVPIIVAFWLKTSPYADWGSMLDVTGLTIDYGDNPPGPNQLTINKENIVLPAPKEEQQLRKKLKALIDERESKIKGSLNQRDNNVDRLDKELEQDLRTEVGKIKGTREMKGYEHFLAFDKARATLNEVYEKRKAQLDEPIWELRKEMNEKINEVQVHESLMRRFRISTKIFTAIVPESQYGLSAKDFIEEAPIAPNDYPAMVDGFFVMLKFSPGMYWIHSWASAPREARGPYFSELLYQVQVHERSPPPATLTRWRPARNERVLNQILEQKKSNGDLTKPEINRLKTYFTTSDESERKSIMQT